jgi:hypothetical protein
MLDAGQDPHSPNYELGQCSIDWKEIKELASVAAELSNANTNKKKTDYLVTPNPQNRYIGWSLSC